MQPIEVGQLYLHKSPLHPQQQGYYYLVTAAQAGATAVLSARPLSNGQWLCAIERFTGELPSNWQLLGGEQRQQILGQMVSRAKVRHDEHLNEAKQWEFVHQVAAQAQWSDAA